MIVPLYQTDIKMMHQRQRKRERERKNSLQPTAARWQMIMTITLKLTGNTLEAFNEFWDTFGYKKGKAEAADAFLSVYSPDIRDDIMAGARRTAENRQSLIEKGQPPKMPQGWLSGRRWEDETSPITSSENHDYMQGVQL